MNFTQVLNPTIAQRQPLIRVFNDLLLTAGSGSSAVLVLLELSAAYDTVDCSILLKDVTLLQVTSWWGEEEGADAPTVM